MKQINTTFEDDEHKKLVKKKDGLNWREFILLLLDIPDQKIKEAKIKK